MLIYHPFNEASEYSLSSEESGKKRLPPVNSAVYHTSCRLQLPYQRSLCRNEAVESDEEVAPATPHRHTTRQTTTALTGRKLPSKSKLRHRGSYSGHGSRHCCTLGPGPNGHRGSSRRRICRSSRSETGCTCRCR
jgi:hypothetical protein